MPAALLSAQGAADPSAYEMRAPASKREGTADGIATTRAGRAAWLRDNESNTLSLVKPAA